MFSIVFALLLPAALGASRDIEQVKFRPSALFPWIHNFASIGDSYAAGLGAGERIDWLCSRYARSYPNILHTSLLGENPKRRHQFLACTGATTSIILHTQIPVLHNDIDLLTISAGGNDIGLTPILNDCIYQFYMAKEADCHKAIQQARDRIENEGELRKNITDLIEAAKPKMNQEHGVIYITGYAGFFGSTDHTCDNVTWAVWSDVECEKQYLKLKMRVALNEMVRSVNTVLQSAVTAAGTHVRFIDYDKHFESVSGRYCEAGVHEPAPNRPGLLFYEWNTVDSGENSTELLNRTGEDVWKGSFEGDIAECINKTLQDHPNWQFDPDKGFVNKTKTTVSQEGLVGDLIHWLLPDAWKRVFHMRPQGHAIVARMILEDLEVNGPGVSGAGEVQEL